MGHEDVTDTLLLSVADVLCNSLQLISAIPFQFFGAAGVSSIYIIHPKVGVLSNYGLCAGQEMPSNFEIKWPDTAQCSKYFCPEIHKQ